MSGPIKTTDITGKPFWAIQEAFGKPITAYQMAGMLNAAIKHNLVSLPKTVCEHWCPEEFPEGTYESRCCPYGIVVPDNCELWDFCPHCGGKVEIVDCPEEFKCDE